MYFQGKRKMSTVFSRPYTDPCLAALLSLIHGKDFTLGVVKTDRGWGGDRGERSTVAFFRYPAADPPHLHPRLELSGHTARACCRAREKLISWPLFTFQKK